MEEEKQGLENQSTINVVSTPKSKEPEKAGDLLPELEDNIHQSQSPSLVPTGVQVPASVIAGDQSQQFTSSSIPDEVKKWNWGAFLLTWIWGIGNGVFISLIALIPGAGFIMAIILGIKGGEWAWQTGRFASVEEYKKKQKAWAMWGIVYLILSLMLFYLFYYLLYKITSAPSIPNFNDYPSPNFDNI